MLEYSRITLPPLVTLAEAKAHLRVTDTAHDADITQILATAQEAIVAYEALAADPTWDAASVPRAVKHAILLLLTHYYEHRGDDMIQAGAGAVDEGVWAAIGRLLAFYRDPTLA
jgi:Phage gp6-like head-tail connector protein